MNQVLGNGGGGYGDSGGPRFWVNPPGSSESEYLVSITERGDPNLVTLDVTYRIDTPVAQDFIEAMKEEYPLGLSLLGGDARAGKSSSVFWPSGGKLVVNYIPNSAFGPSVSVGWPLANGADHYRVTVIEKYGNASRVFVDRSPATYTIGADGLAYVRFGGVVSGRTYMITVTAYSDPDEGVAYSESLQARTNGR